MEKPKAGSIDEDGMVPVPKRTIPSPASLLLTFLPLSAFLFSFSKPFPPQHLCFGPIGAPAGLLSFAGAEGLNCH